MTHLHIIVLAATDKVGEQFSGVTSLDLIGTSAKEAVERAKKLCGPEKRHFHVQQIIEHHDHKEVTSG